MAKARRSLPKTRSPEKPAARRAPKAATAKAAAPARRSNKLKTPTDLKTNAVTNIADALNAVLADTFTLYLKTKNFHWHVSGPHFRDYHLMLDKQSGQLIAITDAMAERVRKLSGTTLRSIGHIGRLQRLKDNDQPFVAPEAMLKELLEDNRALIGFLREAHEVCDRGDDVATASLIEEWIDAAEKRVWFLFETTR